MHKENVVCIALHFHFSNIFNLEKCAKWKYINLKTYLVWNASLVLCYLLHLLPSFIILAKFMVIVSFELCSFFFCTCETPVGCASTLAWNTYTTAHTTERWMDDALCLVIIQVWDSQKIQKYKTPKTKHAILKTYL